MAAGVSIYSHSWLKIALFAIFLLATNGVEDVRYSVTDLDESYYVDFVPLSRSRRAAEDNVTITTNDAVTSELTSTLASTRRPDDATTSVVTATPSPPPFSQTTGTPELVELVNDHAYYVSSIVLEKKVEEFWLTEDKWALGRVHGTLSHSHRTASTIDLSFKFLFYGHEVSAITIATGGFVYMSPFLHQWLTTTQYIAPLMANFDTQLGNNSNVRYYDNGTTFVVWWEDIYLQDQHEAGSFSFQALLSQDGTIVFSYKDLPVSVDNLMTKEHPVKVGLSDAYYFDQEISRSGVLKRTIYEYHRVEIQQNVLKANSAVIITPLPTCILMKSCASCLLAHIGFNCGWCPKIERCSDGKDRMRQEWLRYGCDQKSQNTAHVEQCPLIKDGQKQEGASSKLALLALIPLFVLLGSGIAWVAYAYMNPQTKSGQWLIEHRPSNLKNRLSEVRFWKREESGEKYEVSVTPDGNESVA